MIIYKIQNIETKLYSTGSSNPGWTKQGKTWNSLQSLNSHITLVKKENKRMNKDLYKNCEIVELETIEKSRIEII